MAKRYQIELTEAERQQLERWLKNPPRPYLRERARAILRIADGQPIGQVAPGLRIKVRRNAVSSWAHRFQERRIAGLWVQPGRGRKPCFSPSQPSPSPAGP